MTTITVSAADAGMPVGQTRQVTAEARDQHGAVMTGVAFSWASSNSTVVSVAGGVATGHSAGTAGITASSGGVTSQPLTVTVTAAAPAQGSRVVIDKVSVFLPATGQTARLSAQLVDPQGAASPAGVVWTSSAPDKVSVDAGGQLVALAIGSAQVFAQVGTVRSPPTLVFVAEPRPGSTLVTDAQVVTVGPFTGLAPGAAPGVGSHYEVTLTGVAAPVLGSVVLAAETAPIVGTVVATRQEAAGLVVTLALAPLYQVFTAYDIALAIDLSAFAFEPLASRSGQSAQAARSTTLAARWNAERDPRRHALAGARPLDVLEPFKAFDCDPEFTPQVIAAPISLTLDNKLNLVLLDRPGYSKHALEGSANIVGSAGITLKAGVKFGGRCDAQGQLKLPVFGWFSALVMPAVRFGLGAQVEAEVLVVQGELGVTGSIGVSPVLGWECGGASLPCRSL
ncbi:MAG: Ig-like domain-containing protein, partial [Pseudomonadota bacterium]